MSKVVSRSCCSTTGAGGVRVPAFVAIASSLQFYSRKHFRVHLYARPFGAPSHVTSATCSSYDYKVALHNRTEFLSERQALCFVLVYRMPKQRIVEERRRSLFDNSDGSFSTTQ